LGEYVELRMTSLKRLADDAARDGRQPKRGARDGDVAAWMTRTGTELQNALASAYNASAAAAHNESMQLVVSCGWLEGMWRIGPGERTVDERLASMLGVPGLACTDSAPVGRGVQLVAVRRKFEGESATSYGDPVPESRKAIFNASLDALVENGLLVWIDQGLPMYRKTDTWRFGHIGLLDGIGGKRFRVIVLFQKRTRGGVNVPPRDVGTRWVDRPAGTGQMLGARYAKAFPKRPTPGCTADGALFYGVWQIGNDYRNKSTFHGAYPGSLLQRYEAILGGEPPGDAVLHLFAGGLPASPSYVRFDIDASRSDMAHGNAEHLSVYFGDGTFDVIYADPPYSTDDARLYGCAELVRRDRVLAECAKVVRPGGFIVWLDCISWEACGLPVPAELAVVGLASVVRSTNHRFRVVTIWQRRRSG